MINRNPEGFVLCCDIDNTLVPIRDMGPEVCAAGYVALDELCLAIDSLKQGLGQPFHFGTATGRTNASHTAYEKEIPAFGSAAQRMDFNITSVGTVAHFCTEEENLRQDPDWPWVSHWDAAAIRNAMKERPELQLQAPENQNTHKVSYEVTGVRDTEHSGYVHELTDLLSRRAVQASVVFSGGEYLDFIPPGVNKGTALRYASKKLARHKTLDAPAGPFIIAAGDSMNDCDLLAAADLAILPANAHASLRQWATAAIPDKLCLANKSFAAGILEGLGQLERE